MDQRTEICMICHELLKNKICHKLKCCGKVIHEDCIHKWVEQKKNCINTCPNCREDIKSYLDLVDFGDKDMVEFVDLDD